MKKVVMSGNQAVARGFWEAGGVVASSYPGSPTVEILESVQQYREISGQWAMSEKVALEVAIGASMAGARSMASMKHVGLNIAADPFMTFTQTRTNGGFVVVVGDDPGLSSSQNEQDTRIYARFAHTAMLEPSTPQEVKDYVKQALSLSEEFGTPVIIRLTSNLCHSRGIVTLGEREERDIPGFVKDQPRYTMLPPHANRQQLFMHERIAKLQAFAESAPINSFHPGETNDTLIVTSSLPYSYLMELQPKASILKLGVTYPLPLEKIRQLALTHARVIVLEELMPLIENELRSAGLTVKGKEYFPFTGELTSDAIRIGLKKAGVPMADGPEGVILPAAEVSTRTPMLCAGCPHRPIFDVLREAEVTVIGDIGCYSLGILEPFEVLNTVISMGASLGMVQGMARAHRHAGITHPLVVTIGDGTFFHSGLTGFADLARTEDNITVIVLDNRTTAMTGGQATPTTRDYLKDESLYGMSIAEILASFGITDVQEIDQFHLSKTRRIITEALERDGLSVIIAKRPCALNFKVVNPYFFVDPQVCISCRRCIQVNCPPISMQDYPDIDDKKSYINPDMCVGCSVCSQVCPVKAIKSSALLKKVGGTK